MTRDDIARILKSLRLNAGYTQKEAAEAVGKKQQTLASWETSQSQPDADTLFVLCDFYGVSVDDAFGFTKKENLTNTETAHIKKYRDLDGHGKKIVDLLLSEEHNRILSYEAKPISSEEIKKTRTVNLYDAPASAGSGVYLSDDYKEPFEIPITPLMDKVDSCIRVSGDSMEPTYSDGDILLIKEQFTLAQGEIGIFILNNEGFVKKLGRDILISLNSEYEDIKFTEDDSLKVFGKVIGKI